MSESLSDDQTRASADHTTVPDKTPRSWAAVTRLAALGLAACVGSGAALYADMAPRAGAAGLEKNLASLAETWGHANRAAVGQSAAQTVALSASRPPIVGDEGFWLSRRDVAAEAPGVFSVGDRITLAAPLRGGDAGANKTTIFEVVDLKPLNNLALAAVAPAGTDPQAAAGPTGPLTVVTCREQPTEAGRAPRIVRFLIEGAPADQIAPAAPKTL